MSVICYKQFPPNQWSASNYNLLSKYIFRKLHEKSIEAIIWLILLDTLTNFSSVRSKILCTYWKKNIIDWLLIEFSLKFCGFFDGNSQRQKMKFADFTYITFAKYHMLKIRALAHYLCLKAHIFFPKPCFCQTIWFSELTYTMSVDKDQSIFSDQMEVTV